MPNAIIDQQNELVAKIAQQNQEASEYDAEAFLHALNAATHAQLRNGGENDPD